MVFVEVLQRSQVSAQLNPPILFSSACWTGYDPFMNPLRSFLLHFLSKFDITDIMTTVELNCHISSSNITHLILCLYQMCLGCSYTMRTGIQLYEQVNRRATHTHTPEHARKALSGDEEGHCQKSNKEAVCCHSAVITHPGISARYS